MEATSVRIAGGVVQAEPGRVGGRSGLVTPQGACYKVPNDSRAIMTEPMMKNQKTHNWQSLPEGELLGVRIRDLVERQSLFSHGTPELSLGGVDLIQKN